jgi:hypothetical protein
MIKKLQGSLSPNTIVCNLGVYALVEVLYVLNFAEDFYPKNNVCVFYL